MKWHVNEQWNWLSLTSSLLPFPDCSKFFYGDVMHGSDAQIQPSVSSSWIPSTWMVLDVSGCECGYNLKLIWDPRPGTELLSCKLHYHVSCCCKKHLDFPGKTPDYTARTWPRGTQGSLAKLIFIVLLVMLSKLSSVKGPCGLSWVVVDFQEDRNAWDGGWRWGCPGR